MWRERLNVKVSNAELQVKIELQNRHLLRHLESEGTVILFTEEGIEFVAKEKFTKKMVEESEGLTIPDFLPKRRYGIHPFYLDGPPHKRNGVRERDERIDETLRSYGVDPTRFSYTPPLPKYLRNQICDRIEGVLNGK